MKALSRKKKLLVLLLILALGIFLPPNINGKRFKPGLASTLAAALGRPVTISSVSFRLLPRPGFDLYDLKVADDPAFSAEPLLSCGKVTADLRLTSLWQGRLEIANLKLQNETDKTPPSLNLVYLNGHWNLESLLERAERVPTAPTGRKRAESRARFPYIEADAGRINVKSGMEKKPYALAEADFAFWLAAEDVWHLRLQGKPIRTDINLSDTGRIKVEGDLKRAADWRETPVQLQVSWSNGQLGQLSRLALGHDKGWRGDLDAKLELTGTLRNLHLAGHAELNDFRRFDINRGGMFTISTRCQGEYRNGFVDFDCGMPVESGGVHINGEFAPAAPENYDLSVVANRVPLSALATLARLAKRSLPNDITATGQLDAAFAFHSHDHTDPDWHGTGSMSPFLVRSSAIANPVQFSSIHFHLDSLQKMSGASASPPRGKRRTLKTAGMPEVRALLFDPFTMQLGPTTTLQAQGEIRSTDYGFLVRGAAPLEKIIEVGNMSGFDSRIHNVGGTATLDLSYHGAWANFAPAHLGGSVHLDSVTAAIPGIKNRLVLPTADAHFSDSEMTLILAAAQFENSPVAVKGSVTAPLSCQAEASCPLEFNLQSNSVSGQDLAALFDFGKNGWQIPFVSADNKLPDFRASGTLILGNFTIAGLALQKVITHAEIGDRSLHISRFEARVADGSLQGDWRVDWSSAPVRYTGSGSVTGFSLERLPAPDPMSSVLASWIAGKANLKYSLNFSGATGKEMLTGAQGRVEFLMANGLSRTVTLESARPTRFQTLQGQCEINRGILEFGESKFKVDNRVYEIGGKISLTDRQARLKVSNNAAQWDITGTLEKPNISSQRLTAQQVSGHHL